MKKVYFLLAAFIISAVAIAQETPHEKQVLSHDLAKERNKRNDVARDILQGHPQRARADHRAAVAYHKQIDRDVRQAHRNGVRRPPHHPHFMIRHHRRPVRHHRRVVLHVRH